MTVNKNADAIAVATPDVVDAQIKVTIATEETEKLMYTDTSGNAKVATNGGLVDATYGVKYYLLTVDVETVAAQDYSQLNGTYYVHIDNGHAQVRLSNVLTSDHVGADVSGLYTSFSISAGVITHTQAKMYLAVTPLYTAATTNFDSAIAAEAITTGWSITADASAGTVLLSAAE